MLRNNSQWQLLNMSMVLGNYIRFIEIEILTYLSQNM